MKLSALLTCTLLCISSTHAGGKRKQRPCWSPDNCAEVCSDGAWHIKKKGDHEELRCNDTHSDYRWGGMVCTQTIGRSPLWTRDKCGWINGTVCAIDDNAFHHVVCVAEMKYLPEYKLMCSDGKKRWSAALDYPDIKNECPKDRHLPLKFDEGDVDRT